MKTKIKTKLIAITFCIVSVSLMFSGCFTYFYVTKIIREMSIKDSQVKLSQNSFQIKRIQEQTKKIAEYIVSDEEILSLIKKKAGLTQEQEYFQKKNAEEKLRKFSALNDFIINILIVRDGEMFSNNSGYEDYFKDYLTEKWYTELPADSRFSRFSAPHAFFSSSSGNRYQPVLSYVIRYSNILDVEDKSAYSLILDLKFSVLENAFQQSLGQYEQIVLLNSQDQTLYNSMQGEHFRGIGMSADGPDANEGFWEDHQQIIIYNASMLENWKQVAILSKEKLFAKINSILLFFILVILSSLILILSIMTPIIAKITKPVSRMVSAMKRVSDGDLNTSVSIRSGDELEILGSGFNRMVYELKEHVRSSVETEKLKRNMQLKLLMAQINPHFIYNTLNTVIYLSHANRNRDAENMAQALIGVLQDSVHTGDNSFFSTLEEEIRIVEKYIDIQQFRYPDRFTVQWRIEESLKCLVVPKMILQPIVENALFHGICSAYMEEPGLIRIKAARTEDVVEISVEDNGRGMDAEELDGVFKPNAKTAGSAATRGIGLANVKERIQYHYGAEYGIDVASRSGRGTRVVLQFPHDPRPATGL